MAFERNELNIFSTRWDFNNKTFDFSRIKRKIKTRNRGVKLLERKQYNNTYDEKKSEIFFSLFFGQKIYRESCVVRGESVNSTNRASIRTTGGRRWLPVIFVISLAELHCF